MNSTNFLLSIREPGSGSQQFIDEALIKAGIKIQDLQIQMQFDSSEGIKNYLLNSNCVAFISINSVLRERSNQLLKIIDIPNFSIERDLHYIVSKGDQSQLIQLFMRSAL